MTQPHRSTEQGKDKAKTRQVKLPVPKIALKSTVKGNNNTEYSCSSLPRSKTSFGEILSKQ